MSASAPRSSVTDFAMSGEGERLVRNPWRGADGAGRSGSSKAIHRASQSAACQQPHAPGCRLAPRRRPPVPVPHADLPVTAGATGERPAGIRHVQRGIRAHLAAVPQIPVIRGQSVRRRRHQHPVGGLYLRALSGLHDPAQPRPCRVDAQRIDQVLAAQPIGYQSRSPIQSFHPTRSLRPPYSPLDGTSADAPAGRAGLLMPCDAAANVLVSCSPRLAAAGIADAR